MDWRSVPSSHCWPPLSATPVTVPKIMTHKHSDCLYLPWRWGGRPRHCYGGPHFSCTSFAGLAVGMPPSPRPAAGCSGNRWQALEGGTGIPRWPSSIEGCFLRPVELGIHCMGGAQWGPKGWGVRGRTREQAGTVSLTFFPLCCSRERPAHPGSPVCRPPRTEDGHWG